MHLKGYEEFEWEIRNSKKGDKTLLLGGRAVYSLRDPLEDAKKTAHSLIEKSYKENCDHIIIIGLGLGYLPRALHDSGFSRILVWEPFPVMQKSFAVCGGRWRESVAIVSNHKEFEERILNFTGKGAKPKLIVHPGYNLFCRLEHRLALQSLRNIYAHNTQRSYIVSRRSLETLVRLPFLNTIKDYENVFDGKKALLVNAGPSLKQGLDVLKRIDGCLIFASLQAAPLLQKSGIRVHFLVCSDPRDYTLYMKDCDDSFDAFFTETCSHPATLDWQRDKTRLFHLRSGQVHEMLWEEAGLPVFEGPAATVSEVMLLLADYMGFNEIYCMGMDFCWSETRYAYRTEGVDKFVGIKDDASTEFSVMTGDNCVAKTKCDYFHAARFMRQKYLEMKSSGKRMFQLSNGIRFTDEGQLKMEDIYENLNRDQGTAIINSAKTATSISEELTLKLLEEIRANRINTSVNTSGRPQLRLWPFLRAIPPEELKEVCSEFIDALRRMQKEAHENIFSIN